MKTNYLSLIILAFFVIFAGSCTDNNDDDPQPIDEIDFGPQDDDYDYYIAMSFTEEQPANPEHKNYYILITCTNTDLEIETVEIEIQDSEIDLEYANYGGPDFYIANFTLEYADIYKYKITINGETTETEYEMPTILYAELPLIIEPNEDIELNWSTDKDPMVIYVEGFQRDANRVQIERSAENFYPETREFTMPAEWLWKENDGIAMRDIIIGIKNYKVENRICFTMSNDSYRVYQ